MAAIEDELKRLNTRQEAMVSAMHGLTDVMQQTRDLVAELMAWLQEPPSSDMADTLKALVQQVQEQNGHLKTIGEVLIELPGRVARSAGNRAAP